MQLKKRLLMQKNNYKTFGIKSKKTRENQRKKDIN